MLYYSRLGNRSLEKADGQESSSIDNLNITGDEHMSNVSGKNGYGEETTKLLSRIAEVEAERDELRQRFERLTVEKETTASELDQQTKVNSELKRLLVASMGDDLQLHLESLSNDRVQLARHIDTYSRQISADSANFDQLLIENDIWRSKYLASSVMVDELVSWRLYLIKKFVELQVCVGELMEERDVLHGHMLHSSRLLRNVKRHISEETFHNQNILSNSQELHWTIYDLAVQNHSLADAINTRLAHMLGKNLEGDVVRQTVNKVLGGLTEAEQNAAASLKVDSRDFYPSSPSDEIRKELTSRRAKTNMGFGQQCNFKNLTIQCCKKCAGRDLKLV